jgi:hypothetical protein
MFQIFLDARWNLKDGVKRESLAMFFLSLKIGIINLQFVRYSAYPTEAKVSL